MNDDKRPDDERTDDERTDDERTDDERTDDKRPTAEYYRGVAAEIDQLAEQTQLPELRRELYDLAKRFRRMAERRESRDSD
jgi:hypothetical protein